ncbi:terminase small subunit [Hymenobacter negativus]|uniref:Terminase small subunit n=1 Tax=Hymenobacter negativus TaxID=2795026 RepID=A0ABS3QI79_9BACT|nr:terminase small subunit [Hymenobacter negativus]MBO2010882.1 terminase small subunit [Hymenobacter negativus]
MPPAENQPTLTAYEQLTAKQKAFVDALCLEPNISHTKAAERAGYAKKSAFVEGSRLLRNAKVRKALGEQLKGVAPTSEEIAVRWDRVSRATLEDFYTTEEYEEPTTELRPLLEKIADLSYQIDFEERVATRQELEEDQLEKHRYRQQQRRNEVIRLEVELEMNPAATYEVPGPPAKKQRLQLDLVKAQKAGVLDLAKAIKPTQFGLGIELRDPDAALDKLARMSGAYEKDNEQSRAVAVINAKVEVISSGVPIARSEQEAAAHV